jgi:hypothetical protein
MQFGENTILIRVRNLLRTRALYQALREHGLTLGSADTGSRPF